jgi:glutaredoxin 2
MKLYHYVHCPFCVRVRMACGFLNIKYESKVVPYNDEKTPIDLTGVKMLPIFEFNMVGDAINESLDIISRLDTENKLNSKFVIEEQYLELEELTNLMGKDVHNLAMPYWIWTPEFDESSRSYFENKKSKKRGPFKDLVHRREEFISSLSASLEQLETKLMPFYNGENMDLADIIIASHLWGMYVVPEFQFSDDIHHYLQSIAKNCNFNYHEDYWR